MNTLNGYSRQPSGSSSDVGNKILGYIHTLNDEDVIERSIEALLDQTFPVEQILVVDNGSTDATLEKLEHLPVTVIRHRSNRGTSGSVVSGFRYAIRKHYDWIWLFDADSAPHHDALEKLVSFYQGVSPDLRRRIWLLSGLHIERDGRYPYYQATFSSGGYRNLQPKTHATIRPFDSTIWSGSLYKLNIVQEIGLPSLDYVLDWGEHEYGYRGKQHGYLAFLCEESIVEHNIGNEGPALGSTPYKIGPLTIRMRELPPIRCYYLVRNMSYFWLYAYYTRNLKTLTLCFLRVGKLTASFLLRARTRWPQASACLRGFRDGIFKKMERRY